MALALLMLVVCSAQTCSLPDTTTDKNICDRNWFNGTYRVGIDLPSGVGAAHAGTTVNGADLNVAWDWDVIDPAVTFSVVVFEPLVEDTLAEFREAWLETLTANNQFVIMIEQYMSLDDGTQGWYLAITPTNQEGINIEYVMTVTQGRLVYVSATYGADLVSDTQADQIGEVLQSLCADLQ
jgi:hypothetical protein